MRLAAFAVLASLAGGALAASRATISPSRYLDHVKYLASDELGGRGTGTPGLEKAARYLAGRYKALGLEPAFPGGYLQPFSVTTNAKLGSKNRLSESVGNQKLKSGQDFLPFNFSSSGKISAPVVFAGYGITANEYGYDDYAGIDVTGKIVLVLRHEPQEYNDKSVFEGRVYTRHAQFDSKAINAKMHGAKAVILINNPVTHAGDGDRLEAFGRTAGPSEAGIPMIQMKPAVARPWIEAAGKSFQEIVEGIDRDLKPRSFAFPEAVKVTLEVDLIRETRTVHNVGAMVRGQTEEYVVIGAHYDHLGLGEQFSLAPSQVGKVHPGADDNASGTAGVLELAAAFAGQRPRRTLIFTNFAAEEIGLLGSSWFTEHAPIPIGKCAAMLNMDMVGRMKDGAVIVGGAGTASGFKALLDQEAGRFPQLKLEYSEQSGVGSSDHTSFTAKRVPVLFFFTGLHGDYHRPSDTWDKINAEGAVQLLGLVGDIANEIAESESRPEFTKTSDSTNSHAAGSSVGGGYGPSFGSLPDMAFTGKGVRFSDLRAGSPAEKAGLKAGDVMVAFDGKAIENLYDFTYALRGKQPGEEVTVKVMRQGEPYTVQVKLEARK